MKYKNLKNIQILRNILLIADRFLTHHTYSSLFSMKQKSELDLTQEDIHYSFLYQVIEGYIEGKPKEGQMVLRDRERVLQRWKIRAFVRWHISIY